MRLSVNNNIDFLVHHNMNVVGFIKEHEIRKSPNLGIPLNLLFSSEHRTVKERRNIASYLDNGSVLIKALHYVFDETDDPIGPYSILTDGQWIWPGYYAYYILKRDCVVIPKLFYDQMVESKFVTPKLSEQDRHNAELFYMRIFPPTRPLTLRREIEKAGLLNEQGMLDQWWR